MWRQDRIISKVKQSGAKKYFKRKINFGIEFPKTVQESMSLDNNNDNILWADSIAKEMCPVWFSFYIREKGGAPPQEHQFIKCHMVFNVKIEDQQCKARMVAGGHMTKCHQLFRTQVLIPVRP